MKRKQIVFLILFCITIVFIWGNSLLPPEQSNAISNPIAGSVGQQIENYNISNDPQAKIATSPEYEKLFGKDILVLVRKSAHITEFLLLGIFTVLLLFFEKEFTFSLLWLSLLIGICTGWIDETIQIFNRRTPLVEDIWIDFGGFIIGLAITVLIRHYRTKRKKKIKE